MCCPATPRRSTCASPRRSAAPCCSCRWRAATRSSRGRRCSCSNRTTSAPRARRRRRRVATAQAQLDNLRKGRRPEEIAAIRAQFAQAQAALSLSQANLERQQQLVARQFRFARGARRGQQCGAARPRSSRRTCRAARCRPSRGAAGRGACRRRSRGGRAAGAGPGAVAARPEIAAGAGGRTGAGHAVSARRVGCRRCAHRLLAAARQHQAALLRAGADAGSHQHRAAGECELRRLRRTDRGGRSRTSRRRPNTRRRSSTAGRTGRSWCSWSRRDRSWPTPCACIPDSRWTCGWKGRPQRRHELRRRKRRRRDRRARTHQEIRRPQGRR